MEVFFAHSVLYVYKVAFDLFIAVVGARPNQFVLIVKMPFCHKAFSLYSLLDWSWLAFLDLCAIEIL
jgi:hypothetical protein